MTTGQHRDQILTLRPTPWQAAVRAAVTGTAVLMHHAVYIGMSTVHVVSSAIQRGEFTSQIAGCASAAAVVAGYCALQPMASSPSRL
jgi:hypothetical protein